MPLNTNYKLSCSIFDRFDHSIRRGRRHTQIPSRPFDALMMKTIHLDIQLPGQLRQTSTGFEMQGMPGFVMDRRIRYGRRNILHQRTAAKHIDALHTKTNPENRKVTCLRMLQQSKIGGVSFRIQLAQFEMGLRTIARGIHIRWTSGKKNAVDPIEVLANN